MNNSYTLFRTCPYAKIKWAQAVWWNDIHKIKMFLIWNNFMWEQPNDWDLPLEVIKENSKTSGFKIRKIWQPVDSLIKLPNQKNL